MIGKHKTTLIIYSIIFVVMMIAFIMNGGYGSSEESRTVTDSSFVIGYVDDCESVVSRGLIGYLGGSNELVDLKGMSEDSVKTMVFFTTVNASIKIDENFDLKIQSGDDTAVTYSTVAESGPSMYIIESMINEYIRTYNTFISMGYEPGEAVDRTNANLELKADAYVYANEGEVIDSSGKLFTLAYMSKFFIYVSFGVLMQCIGMVIIKSNSSRVSSRIKVSPVSPIALSVTNVMGLFVFGIVLWLAACIIIMVTSGDLQIIKTQGYAIFIIMFMSCICNCALTSFIASFNINTESLPLLTNILALGMSFLCGVLVPQSVMAPGMVQASRFLPFYWSVVVLDSVTRITGSITDFSNGLLVKSVVMLSLFSAVFVAGGIVVKKTQTYSKIK